MMQQVNAPEDLVQQTNQLVIENKKLVYKVYNEIRKKFDTSQYEEDLIQEGLVALITAARAFSPDLNLSFSTLAYTAIRNQMLKFLKYITKHSTTTPMSFYDRVGVEGNPYSTIESFTQYHQDFSNVTDLIALIIKALKKRHPRKNIEQLEKIIHLLYLGYTQQEIAKIFNCSRQSVQQKIKVIQETIIKEGLY